MAWIETPEKRVENYYSRTIKECFRIYQAKEDSVKKANHKHLIRDRFSGQLAKNRT